MKRLEDGTFDVSEEERKTLPLGIKLHKLRTYGPDYMKKAEKGQYPYASTSALLAELNPIINALGLLLVPNEVKSEMIEIKKPAGVFSCPRLTISYTWYNAYDMSQSLTTQWSYHEDKIAASQASGSIQTYAERYFLYKFFQIATDKDDPEQFYAKHDIPNKIDDQAREEEKNAKKAALKQEKPKVEQLPEDFVHQITHFCNTVLWDHHDMKFLEAFIKAHMEFYEKRGDFSGFIRKFEAWKANSKSLEEDYDRFCKKQ